MPRVVPTQIIAFIDHEFPFARTRQQYNVDIQFKDRVSALVRLVTELPDELITIDDIQYNTFVLSVETMRSAISLWDSHGVSQQYVDRRVGSSIVALRDCMFLLPDEQVPASTAGLLFIKNEELRESIRADVAFADRALTGTEWKAATVLGGAVVEALLLWAIKEQQSGPAFQSSVAKLKVGRRKIDSDPDNWTLDIYRQVATDMGIIGGSTTTQIELAQGFRNLIHPGKAIRTKQQCSRSTAHGALAAMHAIIELFSRNRKPTGDGS